VKLNTALHCADFPCDDVIHDRFVVPDIDLNPSEVSIVLISEASPADLGDFYYAAGDPLFAQTTVQAFRDAGTDVTSLKDVLDLGVYLTTAVKCGKTGYGVMAATVNQCSHLLEAEIAQFPNAKAYLLMGDVAIKALNAISRRRGERRVIPAGSTYKIRGADYWFGAVRAFPSYLQAGPSFFIERSKRRMIAEDIAAALALTRGYGGYDGHA